MTGNVEKALRKFIVDNFLFGEEGDLADDDSFLEKGIIDSTGIMELVSHIESAFKINVENRELVPENLDSISRVSAFVTKKQGETPRAA